MKSSLEKYTSLKELNIQIDLLKDTPQGVALLKEKFGTKSPYKFPVKHNFSKALGQAEP